VVAGGEELAEARGGFRDRIRCGNADNIKTLALAVRDEEGFRLACVFDQKSRSA